MSNQNVQYSILMYDVPLKLRSVYSKLRARIKRVALPLNWSVYLIPDAIREDVTQILSELDEQIEGNDRIFWKVLKFDPVEKEELDRLAIESFNRLVKNTREYLSEKVAEAEREYDEGEIDWLKMNARRKRAVAKALKDMKEAKRLSMLFDTVKIMEVAFQSVERIALSHRERIKEEIAEAKKKDEQKKKELEEDLEEPVEME